MKLAQFGGAKSEDEEKLLAVKEYLMCELKFNLEEIDSMMIENIFIPAKDKDDPQSLNVTFSSMKSVSAIYEKTRIMRKESRIINYIPRQFQERLAAVSAIDYSLRADKRHQTRIKMGPLDLELHKKLRGTTKWVRVDLPRSLPPVDLSSRQSAPLSHSPPPGRPGHEDSRDKKRGRVSTGSDSGQNSSKISKQNEASKEDGTAEVEQSWEKAVEKAVLVSEGVTSPNHNKSEKLIDPGMITSIEGTPSKIYPSLGELQSPILSRFGRQNTK
jgi:hypothetical protein